MGNKSDQKHLSQLAFAFGTPCCSGKIKSCPEDFQVNEHLSFQPDCQGNHVYLYLQKRNINTEDIAKRLALVAGTKPVAIGYAGLKDKYALTSQWFSIDLSGKGEPDWHQIENHELTIIDRSRHSRKLRRGAIKHNVFKITIRALQGDVQELKRKLTQIELEGVPNYFGSQRFGHNEQNLNCARALFSGTAKFKSRFSQGLYLSAARSLLFNKVLSFRVEHKNWNCGLPGDAMLLDGTNSFFNAEIIDTNIIRRLEEKDIHPTGPLYGKGKSITNHQVSDLEQNIFSTEPLITKGLEKFQGKMGRRSLRLQINNMQWQLVSGDHPDKLQIQFDLCSGSYATSVLRELICLE